MREALEIMTRLLAGEKLDFEGQYYTCHKAKLYSPPIGRVPIWMAAGGKQSATFAGKYCEGIITSVKDPADTVADIIEPFQESHGRHGTVMATRWIVLAGDTDEAWEALGSMRGLRAPGRLEEVDPAVLRERADAMDRSEILNKYTVVRDAAGLIDAYRPLVNDVGADVISIQVAATDPHRAIELIGSEVLPELKKKP
jgi:coenzyme F420-dependent glucose-6-phosphate dehydrogenase